MFSFRLELARGLVGSFKSHQHSGHPRSFNHAMLDRFNPSLGIGQFIW